MTASRARKELRPEDLTCLVDSREQLPMNLAPMKMQPGTLPTGDYSIVGLEHLIAVERKSLPDLLGCIGQERERFERELQRLLAFECRALVVESSWSEIERGEWRQKVTPQAAMGSLIGWVAMGIPVVMAGSRELAQQFVGRFLFIAARRRWRELLVFSDGLRIAPSEGRTE